ncbi:MAG: hypothetical protein KBS64_05460 [Treponema sp.]|nr:hypothetical protein [Candidatus Treponema equi]
MCWKCKNNIEIESIYRDSECPVCHSDLHSCRNCKFYSPGSHFDCRENVDELVSDKGKANFCDAFMVNRNFTGGTTTAAGDKATAARNAFEALFSL